MYSSGVKDTWELRDVRNLTLCIICIMEGKVATDFDGLLGSVLNCSDCTKVLYLLLFMNYFIFIFMNNII